MKKNSQAHTHTPHRTATIGHTKRLDIQGLRAIAVLAVVANHMFSFPKGGFVGVDIFFVISGFVITLGLMREHERSESISFKDFYFRRVARIIPAGALTILATVCVGYLVFFAERANTILFDGLWALLFSANWRFAIEDTDYWAEDVPVSPLQHYWSLGVEEQFYFAWPLLLFIVLGACARHGFRTSQRRYILAVILAGIIMTSFIWAIAETASSPSWAYFSTFSRVWELGIGALLAIIQPIFSRLGSKPAEFLGLTGILGLIVSITIVSKELLFPAPWAALPVLSTAMVIVACNNNVPRVLGFLKYGPMTYIGNLSYSLYLWHFPVIIYMVALWPADDIMRYPVMILVMAFLAVVSYEFVEIPAQRNLTVLYKTGFSRSQRRLRSKPHRSIGNMRMQYLGVAFLLVATTVAVPLTFHNQRPTAVGASAANAVVTNPKLSTDESAVAIETNETRLAAQIGQALTSLEWPTLSPSLDNVLTEGKPEEDKFGCGNTDLSIPNCSFGEGQPQTVVILGDSTGITLLPTVRAALGEEYNYRGMTKAGCTLLDIEINMDRAGAVEECQTFLKDALEEINRIKPDVVLLTNDVRFRFSSGAKALNAQEEWRAGTESVLNSLEPSGARLVVVTAPPQGKAPAECATRTSKPIDCVYNISSQWRLATNAMTDAAASVGADMINTSTWFCDSSGTCPSFVENTPVKRDGVHTTPQYAAKLVPVFQDAFHSDG